MKLVQIDGQTALLFDRATLDAAGFPAEGEVRVEVEGDTVRIRPANVGVGEEKVREAMGWVRDRYEKTLRRLAE